MAYVDGDDPPHGALAHFHAVEKDPEIMVLFDFSSLGSRSRSENSLRRVVQRGAKLLSSPWKSDSKEFLRVETIQERKVKLETIDYAHAPFQTHTVWVTVDAMGGVAVAP